MVQRVATTKARRLLEKQGHAVVTVSNGREAVKAFGKDTFDLILMDVQMPELDGREATEAIRKQEMGRSRTPIIAPTAHVMVSDRERCIAAGMDGFVLNQSRSLNSYRRLRRCAGKFFHQKIRKSWRTSSPDDGVEAYLGRP
jgi:CheY-like chemotaxis protein